MPDWDALALGSQPAPGPRVPEMDPEPFLGRLAGALGFDQPSLGSRMAQQGELQQARLARGEYGPPAVGSPEFEAGLDVAGSMDLGGILAGPKSLTAPFEQLSKAKKAQARGWKPETIWNRYGWFKGPDDQWRYEIDDSKARTWMLTGGARERAQLAQPAGTNRAPPVAASLSEVFRHPALRQAYHPVGEMEPKVFYGELPNYLGMRYPGVRYGDPGSVVIANRIAGSNLGPRSERSTMLHELQHMVQELEGFARGGNPGEFQPSYEMAQRKLKEREAVARMRSIMNLKGKNQVEASEDVAFVEGLDAERLRRLNDDYPTTDELMESLAKLRLELEKVDPYKRYKNLAGEAEARAVEARKDFSPETRRRIIPLADYDVPLSELTVRR